ncbi:hypothetical protein NE619_17615, partial [Anaerovorax odorimutans]
FSSEFPSQKETFSQVIDSTRKFAPQILKAPSSKYIFCDFCRISCGLCLLGDFYLFPLVQYKKIAFYEKLRFHYK